MDSKNDELVAAFEEALRRERYNRLEGECEITIRTSHGEVRKQAVEPCDPGNEVAEALLDALLAAQHILYVDVSQFLYSFIQGLAYTVSNHPDWFSFAGQGFRVFDDMPELKDLLERIAAEQAAYQRKVKEESEATV